MKDLLTRLKEYLEKNNLKLEDFAKNANVSLENLQKWGFIAKIFKNLLQSWGNTNTEH